MQVESEPPLRSAPPFTKLLIIPYLSYSIRIIYELKSIVFNTAVLLRYSIAKKLLKFVEEENSQDKK